VVDLILLNLSKLFDTPIRTLQELNRYRKSIAVAPQADAAI
jgi:hypothetical protein